MKYLVTCLLILITLTACTDSDNTGNIQAPNTYDLIPIPAKLIPATGKFTLTSDTYILLEPDGKDWNDVAIRLGEALNAATGINYKTKASGENKDAIRILEDKTITNPEGYTLEVNPYDITIRSSHPAGAFYAVQTLRQLIPAKGSEGRREKSYLPCVKIEDEPRFVYRGMHLDVGRHFFGVDKIKKYIDLLAMHKMNRFHWHLTEDQGWRIEIKKYPKLQEIAAYRKETLVGHYSDQPHQFDGKKYGGFYTQDEIREVVAYAKDRFITVIPEIEMPGHSQAALAAYPELGCTDGPFETATKWGVFEEVYCPTETTFEFLENVLTEVMDLFPSKYIHIGGDECPKSRWKESKFCQNLIKEKGLKDEHGLQSYFIGRMEKFLNKNGRQIIGWDEILEGGLAPNATVMSWRGVKGGIEAAKQNHDVIMTPTSNCYLDYYQSRSGDEPLAIGGYLPLKQVYNYEPIPAELNPEEAKHILGAQGNVWTEYMPTFEQVEYMAFPRGLALAEVTWSPKEKRNYEDFASRLSRYLPHLDAMKVNYANHLFEVKTDISAAKNGISVALSSLAADAKIYYTLDGKAPDAKSKLYKKPITLTKNKLLKAAVYRNGRMLSRVSSTDFNLHLATAKKITLTADPHPTYALGGSKALVNGVIGSDDRYGDGEWLGWSGEDFEATIDLENETELNNLKLRFYSGIGQWIYLPKRIEVAVSSDGKTFKPLTAVNIKIRSREKVSTVEVPLKAAKSRYLKVKALRYGIIPEGAQGAGNEAWLFVDEIVLE